MFAASATGMNAPMKRTASVVPLPETISPLERNRGFPGHHTPRGELDKWWSNDISTPKSSATEEVQKPSLRSRLFDYHDPDTGVKEISPPYRLHHNSTVRKSWDGITILLLLYMSIALPVTVGFSIVTPATQGISSFIDVFFICDIIVNFFTTYEDEHKCLVVGFQEIANHYLHGWFTIDLLSSIPLQWFPGLQDASSTEAVRALKILKLVKLLRIFRLGRMVARFQEKFQIKHATVMIVQFIAFIFIVAHWLGCIFYFVTKLQDDSLSIWSAQYLADTPGGSLENRTDWEKYTAVIYWSLTTMTTIGYGDIVPKTSTERAFVMIAMMLGACFFAYGLTNVCSLIFNHNKYKGRFEAATDELTEYVERRGFSSALSQGLMRSLWFSHNSSTIEDDRNTHTEMLSAFSPDLQRQAYRHLARSTFCTVTRQPPLLCPNERVLVQLFLVTKPVIYPPGEVVWCTYPTQGEWDDFDSVYFVVQGCVHAFLSDTKEQNQLDGDWLGPGSSFGEKQVLLFGDYPVCETCFKASEHTDIYSANRRALRQILSHDTTFLNSCMDFYSKRTYDWLNADELWSSRSLVEGVSEADGDFSQSAEDFCDPHKPLSPSPEVRLGNDSSDPDPPQQRLHPKVDSGVKVEAEPAMGSPSTAWFRNHSRHSPRDGGAPVGETVESLQAQVIESQERLLRLYERLNSAQMAQQAQNVLV